MGSENRRRRIRVFQTFTASLVLGVTAAPAADVMPFLEPTPSTAFYGSDVTLVGNPGSYGVATVDWMLGSTLIKSGADLSLTLPHVSAGDAGTYRFILHATTGSVFEQDFTLDVVPGGRPEVRDPSFHPDLSTAPALVAPLADGRMWVAGAFNRSAGVDDAFRVARLRHDGSVDPTFTWPATLPPAALINGIYPAPDGSLYISGRTNNGDSTQRAWLVRIDPTGAVATGFPITDASAAVVAAAVVAADGALFVQGGLPYSTVLRVGPDGQVDPAFPALTGTRLIGYDTTGGLLVVRKDATTGVTSFQRYLADGTRDTTYAGASENGWSFGDYDRVALTPNGIYSATYNTSKFLFYYKFGRRSATGVRDGQYGEVKGPPLGFIYNGSQVSPFGFAWEPDGSLWQSTGIATLYSPSGDADPSRYATLPDQQPFQIDAIEADGSLLVTTVMMPNSTPVSFYRIKPLTGSPGQLVNVSVRAHVDTEPLIAGIVLVGTGTDHLLARSIGPGLAAFGVTDALHDPFLQIIRGGTLVAQNDNWSATTAGTFSSFGAFPLPTGSTDAAVEFNAASGNVTAVSDGKAQPGNALLELYRSPTAGSDRAHPTNVSARGEVSPQNPLLAGFSIAGDLPVTLMIRAVGPSLKSFGVPKVLAHPQLTLYRGPKLLWQGSRGILIAPSQVGEFPLQSADEQSLTITLGPGVYTAAVSAAAGESGTALVEVYQLPSTL